MILIKKKLVQFFAFVTRKLSISLNKEIQNKNSDLLEIANKDPKLLSQWYKCGKCRKQIELRTMKFVHHKKYGRMTKCPFCKNEIYMQAKTPEGLEYNDKGSLVKSKPLPANEGKIQIKKV